MIGLFNHFHSFKFKTQHTEYQLSDGPASSYGFQQNLTIFWFLEMERIPSFEFREMDFVRLGQAKL
jgi:hypothetical protein